jgi:shikimate kinase
LIALIGLPGSGKSTVGRQLAKRLQVSFLDTDHAIEQRLGCSIREYFEREGEERFRDVEESVIEELSEQHHGVLSTGGGSVLRPKSRENLRNRSQVVYLKSSPDELFRRLRNDMNRPLLQVLFAARDPLYRETAHFILETGRPSVATLVNMIVMQLELAGLRPAP